MRDACGAWNEVRVQVQGIEVKIEFKKEFVFQMERKIESKF